MKKALFSILLLCSLLLTQFVSAVGQGASFVVDGRVCTHNACNLNIQDAALNRALRIQLSSANPTRGPLLFSLSFSDNSPMVSKGTVLEYNGQSISPHDLPLRLSSQEATQLWKGEGALILHLGESAWVSNASVILRAKSAMDNSQVAHVTINLEGMKTPGAAFSWERPGYFRETNTPVIPIYPNPVKSGMIHIDLQGIPYGQKGVVSIIDILGNTMLSTAVVGGDLIEVPSDKFPKGIYFVRVEIGQMPIFAGRLIIDK